MTMVTDQSKGMLTVTPVTERKSQALPSVLTHFSVATATHL